MMSFRQKENIMPKLPATNGRNRHGVPAQATFLNVCRGLFLALFLNFTPIHQAQGQAIGWSNNSISNVINAVANHWQQTLADGYYPGSNSLKISFSAAQSATKPTGLNWAYEWGVNLYGQMRVQEATGNTNWENFALNHNLICGRYYAWLVSLTNTLTSTASLPNFQNTNAVFGSYFVSGRLDYCGSMTAQLLEGVLWHATGPTIQQLQLATATGNYISYQQARLSDGTFWRPTDQGAIWADDLYMGCSFLVRWYQYTGNTNVFNDAVLQVTNMAHYLQDTSGLWFHGYYTNTHAVNGIKPARPNGWAMLGTAEVLASMPTNHPARTNVLNILRRHIAGVEAVQAADGMWRQVLDLPTSWEETSSTALFACCIARAVNYGWIDPTNMAVARKAFAAIAQMEVSPAGVISNICPGMNLSTSVSYYTNSLQPMTDDSHGPGAVMLAGAELLLSPKLNIAAAGCSAAISWNAGLTNFTLQTSTNLTAWNTCTNTFVITNWQGITIDSNAPWRFFRLSSPAPGYPPVPLNFEAESLARVTNGATATVSADTNASGGYYVILNSGNAGNYIEFTLTNVPAGAYHLKLVFRSNSNCGQLNFKVDGSLLGGTLDEYWPTAVYPLWDFGPVTFVSTGNHTVRLTVVGKNVASSSYAITADKFMLVPQ
jgi:rhamnogalacturonyl hydrolase YesR